MLTFQEFITDKLHKESPPFSISFLAGLFINNPHCPPHPNTEKETDPGLDSPSDLTLHHYAAIQIYRI